MAEGSAENNSFETRAITPRATGSESAMRLTASPLNEEAGAKSARHRTGDWCGFAYMPCPYLL